MARTYAASSPPEYAAPMNATAGRGAVVSATLTSYSGPLPPPEIIRECESILPGAAERIFRNFENQSAHRIEIEKKAVEQNGRRESAGMNWGGAIAITAMILSGFVVYLGHPAYAVAIGVTPTAGLVMAFLKANSDRKSAHERQRKADNEN